MRKLVAGGNIAGCVMSARLARYPQALAVLCLSISHVAHAQTFPPPIESPVVDDYGVELKSGRYGGLNVSIISIGGDESSSLSRVYAPQNGREMLAQPVTDHHYSIVNLSNIPNQYDPYEVVTVRYPGGSSSFRRKPGASNWTPEYATGATYVSGATWDSWVFTDKYGVRVEHDKVTYPDGREIFGGQVYSSGADPVFVDVADVRNNFGFRLRTTNLSPTFVTQAVNMALNYCHNDLTTQCQGLQSVRSGSVQRSSRTQVNLTNAAGELTQIVLEPIEAFDSEPTCYGPFGQPCQWNGSKWTYYYPSQVIFPGSTSPNIAMSYMRYGTPGSATHNEILVSHVDVNGVSVDYSNIYSPTGSWGGPNGYQVTVSSVAAGQIQLNAHSRSLSVPAWPLGNLNLENVTNGLSQTTSFVYNAMGTVSRATYPEGNGVEYKFDSRYNVTEVIRHPKTGASETATTTRYEYMPSCNVAMQSYCNLPTAVVDPKGNRTEYTYNARGQILTTTGAAPTAGAARPVTTYTYTMRTAYILDSGGGVVAAGSPISMLTRKSECRTTENCAGTADEIVTEYDYGPTSGPNNLLRRGVTVKAVNSAGQMEVHRTCYRYNYFGDKISETSPSAGLASCP
jgi:YD repeat-containing protein